MNSNFKFSIHNVQVECSHCGHNLEGAAKFGLAIVECQNCGKYTQVKSSVEIAKVRTPIASEA